MKISKNSKKLMSFIMMMALVFSSLVVTQKPAKAAGEVLTVKVMGATLREDDGSGKQAMRFAIQIENADKANDCGIRIRANGKEKEISVKNNYKQIYGKKGNIITYTAVVTGIPASYAEKNFEFSGFVTSIDGQEIPTGTNTRNLKEVADAAGYQITVEGDAIVATAKGGDLLQKESYKGREGKISLNDENLSGKTVKISFEMRVQGENSDGVTMDFQTNYGGDDNPSNPSEKNQTIYNKWTQYSFQWNMPTKNQQNPELYLTKPDGSKYNNNTMNFYVRNFSADVVYEKAVEGTAVGVFSNSEGLYQEFDTFVENNKDVAQLKTNNHDDPGIIVKFELPDGKTLEDYKTLRLRIYSDGSGNKNMGIDWRESKDDKSKFVPNDAHTIYSSNQNHYLCNGKEWKTETFTLNYSGDVKALQSQKGQIVYLGILYKADPGNTVKFTDIILAE